MNNNFHHHHQFDPLSLHSSSFRRTLTPLKSSSNNHEDDFEFVRTTTNLNDTITLSTRNIEKKKSRKNNNNQQLQHQDYTFSARVKNVSFAPMEDECNSSLDADDLFVSSTMNAIDNNNNIQHQQHQQQQYNHHFGKSRNTNAKNAPTFVCEDLAAVAVAGCVDEPIRRNRSSLSISVNNNCKITDSDPNENKRKRGKTPYISMQAALDLDGFNNNDDENGDDFEETDANTDRIRSFSNDENKFYKTAENVFSLEDGSYNNKNHNSVLAAPKKRRSSSFMMTNSSTHDSEPQPSFSLNMTSTVVTKKEKEKKNTSATKNQKIKLLQEENEALWCALETTMSHLDHVTRATVLCELPDSLQQSELFMRISTRSLKVPPSRQNRDEGTNLDSGLDLFSNNVDDDDDGDNEMNNSSDFCYNFDQNNIILNHHHHHHHLDNGSDWQSTNQFGSNNERGARLLPARTKNIKRRNSTGSNSNINNNSNVSKNNALHDHDEENMATTTNKSTRGRNKNLLPQQGDQECFAMDDKSPEAKLSRMMMEQQQFQNLDSNNNNNNNNNISSTTSSKPPKRRLSLSTENSDQPKQQQTIKSSSGNNSPSSLFYFNKSNQSTRKSASCEHQQQSDASNHHNFVSSPYQDSENQHRHPRTPARSFLVSNNNNTTDVVNQHEKQSYVAANSSPLSCHNDNHGDLATKTSVSSSSLLYSSVDFGKNNKLDPSMRPSAEATTKQSSTGYYESCGQQQHQEQAKIFGNRRALAALQNRL